MRILPNLTGPEFLELYVVLFIGALVLRRAIRWFLSGVLYHLGTTPSLTDYETGYLARGRDGAVETAVVKLFSGGLLQLDSEGKSLEQAPTPPRQPSEPLEAAVYECFAAQATAVATPGLRNLSDHHFTHIVERLQARELLSDPGSAKHRLISRAAALPLLVLILVGGLRALLHPAPTWILFVMVVLSFLVWRAWVKAGEPEPTPSGKQLLERLRRKNAAIAATFFSRRNRTIPDKDISLGVALFGMFALAHTHLAPIGQGLRTYEQVLAHKQMEELRSGGCSGGSYSSSDSGGDSDGGGGGGGCGGCGGGGGGGCG